MGNFRTTSAAWVAGLALITTALAGGKPMIEMFTGVIAGLAIIAFGSFAKDAKIPTVEEPEEVAPPHVGNA